MNYQERNKHIDFHSAGILGTLASVCLLGKKNIKKEQQK